MRVRKLSASGDFTFGTGQSNFMADSPEAVAQIIMTTLRLWLGEWYLNTGDGVPYPEGVIGFHNQDTADLTIQSQITSIQVIVSSTNVPPGMSAGQSVQAVRSIPSYSSTIDPVNRSYSATCTIDTIYGPTQVQINNYPDF